MLAKNSRNYNRLLTFVHDLSIVHMCPWTNGPTSMTAKPTKVPVRRRALLLRINRKLIADGQVLQAARGSLAGI